MVNYGKKEEKRELTVKSCDVKVNDDYLVCWLGTERAPTPANI